MLVVVAATMALRAQVLLMVEAVSEHELVRDLQDQRCGRVSLTTENFFLSQMCVIREALVS
jgi:hypothetical protein